MSALDMKADASVLVSGVPDDMSNELLKELMIQGKDNCGIQQMVMFPEMQTALIEFSTPEGAENAYAFVDTMEVRQLTSRFPQRGHTSALPMQLLLKHLRLFFQPLTAPHDFEEPGRRKSGASQLLQGKTAALYMNADACVLVSGFPDYVDGKMLEEHLMSAKDNYGIRQMIMFPEIRTALIEFSTPEGK
ncbi:uncharacterized protein LOC118417446 [Branchiostoma floridae]|uniref:Uncharacterized protein LOC118417446 n=1 Tax=Branchiostoma floridae TaxID=7739 RepID=A0A9J7MS55_BRAFL|nr:uncharacterized protein LOC118417446 [Branchiostoma floridae]